MSVKVFDLLTATPAPVSGKPTPTRTFQWLRNGTAISGANAQTYLLQPADEGALVSVQQIETNLIGKATATSATVGPVEENPFDPDASAYIQAVEAADGEPLEPAIQQAYDTFVRGCKQDGIWEALKASCIMAGARTLSGALVPLVGPAPTNFNFVSGDYDRVTGLKGDGSTKEIGTGVSANSLSLDDHHMSLFVTEAAESSGGARVYMGENSAATVLIYRNSSSLIYRSATNNAGSSGLNANTTDLLAVSRNSSGSHLERAGSITNIRTLESVSLGANNIYTHSRGGSLHTAARIAFYSTGDFLDTSVLISRVSNLMTAIEDALT